MIKIVDLKKKYGNIQAVNGISLEINQGEIVGFLGPNGAGKSTTLKIITGFINASSGTVLFNEQDLRESPIELKKMIGYLPELNPLYSEMLVYDYLKFMAEIRGITGKEFEKTLLDVTQKCGIQDRLSQTIQTLSKGYKQRVGLAQAILHDPPVLILDEPTNGLDPNQIIEIRSLIRELGKEKTVILSSHILQEVQAICDRIIIIHQGVIVADANKSELLKGIEHKQSINVEFTRGNFNKQNFLLEFPHLKIANIKETDKTILLKIESKQTEDIRLEISKYLMKSDSIIIDFKQNAYSLEDVFHLLTQEQK